MADLIVADSEFASQAQRINNCAKELESYLGYLGSCLTDLSEGGGIKSRDTAAALARDAQAIAGMAAEVYRAVANIVAITNEYVYQMDKFDDFPS